MRTLKFFLSLIVALTMMVSVSACDNDESVVNGDDNGKEIPDDPEKSEPNDDVTDKVIGHGVGEDGILKILSIGNSFSVDAVEQYLYELFADAGIGAVIGNLYIGDSTLEVHYNCAMNNSAWYSYRKIVGGRLTTTDNSTMLTGIEDEDWDYISLMQSGYLGGMYDTYEPYLTELIEYVTEHATNEEMEITFHQPWAYPKYSDNTYFLNDYGGDQMYMYNQIVSACSRAVADHGIEIVAPSGTAVQNGRNSWMGDIFNRDSRHLELTYGRYTAACAWFEAYSGIDVTTTNYSPDISAEIKDVVTHAAHFAVQNPYSLDPMTDFQVDPRPRAIDLRELDTSPTTVTVEWDIDDYTQAEAAYYFNYDLAIYDDASCSNLLVGWTVEDPTVWQPGSTARMRFTFSGLEPSTDYWVRVGVAGDESTLCDPVKISTAESLSAKVTATENAGAGDVIVVQDFDKLIHGGDVLHKGAGVIPTTGNRTTLAVPEGDNPTGFSPVNWYVSTDRTVNFSPFRFAASGGADSDYTEAVGLSDWCTGYASVGVEVTTRPGYILVGAASSLGYVATPQLTAIPEGKTAKVKVEFQAMPYHYDSWYCDKIVVGVVDNVTPNTSNQVTAWGIQSDGATLTDSKTVELTQSDEAYTDYTVELEGVTNVSRIRFSSQNTSKSRFLLDNVVVTVEEIE